MHHAVKEPCSGTLEGILAGAESPLATNHIVAIAILRHHLVNHVERVLQIGIDEDHRIADGVIDPGCRRQLVAEVSREAQHLDAAVARAPLGQQLDGAVCAAVVHQDHFTRIQRCIDEAGHLGGKQRQALLLVVAGNND